MNNMVLELPTELFPLVLPKSLSHERFEEICLANPELVIEREADGTLMIMSPVSPLSGGRENEVSIDLGLYARQFGGKAYSSSTGFTLPDTSVKSPDACYVSAEQLAPFTNEQLSRFAKIVPEFVVEIVSPSDRLEDVEKKMRESWIKNGVRLAWLIDVDADRLWIYRADRSVELITPLEGDLTGEDVLPGFSFDLSLLS